MDYKGILVGLGNPGKQYIGTRHNLGFALIDHILHMAEIHGRMESLSGNKFSCELWRCTLGNEKGWWLAAKPTTFMNLSGQCVQPLLAWHKLQPAHLIVLHDELDLAPGLLRFKTGGGNAGHNGLKSITQQLGTPEFHRLRLGIGRPPRAETGGDVSGWVLSKPQEQDLKAMNACLDHAMTALDIFAKEGTKAAASFALTVR